MYLVFHTGVYNGVGTLNANKDGSPKSITIADQDRNRTSGQKVRYSYRKAIKGPKSTQTRLPDTLIEKALTKAEKEQRAKLEEALIQARGKEEECVSQLKALAPTANKEKAEKALEAAKAKVTEITFDLNAAVKGAVDFCEALLAMFLKHSKNKKKKEDPSKTKGKKAAPLPAETEEEEEEEKKFEVVRYSLVELNFLYDCAERRAAGEKITIATLKAPTPSFYEDDLCLWGRMRPTAIAGCFRNSHSIGTHPKVCEDDFYVASDDLLDRAGKTVNSHLGVRGLSCYNAYGCAILNVDLLTEHCKGDKKRVKELIENCVEMVIDHAPKSDSVGSCNQGTFYYLMAEKTDKPNSLEIAFQEPANTSKEVVDRLRTWRPLINGNTDFAEYCKLPSHACGSQEKISEFLTEGL